MCLISQNIFFATVKDQPVITPASKHVKNCHAGLDPASSPVLDSRFRGNDDFDIYCCRSNKWAPW